MTVIGHRAYLYWLPGLHAAALPRVYLLLPQLRHTKFAAGLAPGRCKANAQKRRIQGSNTGIRQRHLQADLSLRTNPGPQLPERTPWRKRSEEDCCRQFSTVKPAASQESSSLRCGFSSRYTGEIPNTEPTMACHPGWREAMSAQRLTMFERQPVYLQAASGTHETWGQITLS